MGAFASVANATPSGGSPQVSTAAPDWTAAGVLADGSPTATSKAVLLVCADKPILAGSINAATLSSMVLYGYGGNGNGTPASPVSQRLPLGAVAGATAAISTNPNCITVTIPPSAATNNLGVDLDGFTVLTINGGAVTDASARPSVPGSVAITPNFVEISPQLGETTGPKLNGVTMPDSTHLVYAFNRVLDPLTVGGANLFGYYKSSGAPAVTGQTLVVSGSTVTVAFAAPITSNVRYFVDPGAVKTQTQEVPNPLGAVGGTIAVAPTITSAAAVTTFPGPGVFDVTYDQPVSPQTAANLVLYLEDNASIPASTAGVTVTSLSSTVLRIALPASLAGLASKVVAVADLGGGAKMQNLPNNASVQSEGYVKTPPMNYGFTDGPDLTGMSLNASAATATFCFDGNYGNLVNAANAAAFQLVNADGTQSAGGTGTPVVSGNNVTVQFSPSQLSTAAGGTLAGPAVEDSQFVTNVFPLTTGTASACSSSSTGTTTVTVTSTVTRTVTNTVTVNNAPCVRSKCGTGVTESVSPQRFGNDRVSGRIMGSHGYCSGNVTIAIFKNGNRIGSKTTGVDSSCTYSTNVQVGNRGGKKLQAHFGGNSFLNGSTSNRKNA
jgi:hypothetical protein